MSIVHVTQIKSRIATLFNGLIDLSDVDKGKLSEKDRESHFLTRALAAYSIYVAAHVEPPVAATAVTDGGDDNGVDAIHYDEREKRLYIVQSKWIHSGKGEPDNGDVKKFVGGVRDLLNQSFERFNLKVREKKAIISQALSEPGFKCEVIIAYTGSDGLADPSRRDLEDLAEEMNDTSEVVAIKTFRQKELHDSLISGLSGEPIALEITFDDWGKLETPHVAYYGRVSGRQIVEWWTTHGPSLFIKNLRGVLGDTEVNEEIGHTLDQNPKHFWYFNNGITLISNTVERILSGGTDRMHGTFRCSNISIVNGAQTVATIGRRGASIAHLDDVYVHVRVISLETADDKFGEAVTKTNNRQNRIDNRDFVSLDPEQIRLRNELAIEGINYHLHRSETVTRSESSLDLVETTTAQACASGDSGMVVQLKREIGKLWENLDKSPYRALFNPATSGQQVWRCVQVQRAIDSVLDEITASLLTSGGRPYSVSVHGNRLIAALVFHGLPKTFFTDPVKDVEVLIGDDTFARHVRSANDAVLDAVEAHYPGSIIPTLFKNASKCKTIYENCIKALAQPPAPIEAGQQQLLL